MTLMERRRALMGKKEENVLAVFVPGTHRSSSGTQTVTVDSDHVAVYNKMVTGASNRVSVPFDITMKYNAGDVVEWKIVRVSGATWSSMTANVYFGTTKIFDNTSINYNTTYTWTPTSTGTIASFSFYPRTQGYDWSSNPFRMVVSIKINGKIVA